LNNCYLSSSNARGLLFDVRLLKFKRLKMSLFDCVTLFFDIGELSPNQNVLGDTFWLD